MLDKELETEFLGLKAEFAGVIIVVRSLSLIYSNTRMKVFKVILNVSNLKENS